ncbi:MAG: hypothetical protein ACRDWS_01395 [Acidimicrobiia bacterium]
MRKYLIAAAVALVAFATTAFAASLQLDGSVLQAGQDRELTCAENAVVDWTTQTVGNGEFAVTRMTVTFDAGCDGNFGYVAVFSAVGPPGGSTQTGFGIGPISGNTVSFEVNESDPNAEVDMINAVSVAVKNSNDAAPAAGFCSGIITGS